MRRQRLVGCIRHNRVSPSAAGRTDPVGDLAGQAVPEFLGGELPMHEPPVALVGGSAKAICWGQEASRLPLTALYVNLALDVRPRLQQADTPGKTGNAAPCVAAVKPVPGVQPR
jgi:hypothetical protein